MPAVEARKDSVRHLLFLYSVVGALSLETAISNLIDVNRSGIPVNWTVAPMTVAFMVTLVPFFHGALRHLDDYHVFVTGPSLKRGALLADFVFLFLQASLLFALASFTPSYRNFLGTLMLLLLLDIVWGTVSQTLLPVEGLKARGLWLQLKHFHGLRTTYRERGTYPQLAWVFNNVYWFIALAVVMALSLSGVLPGTDNLVLGLLIVALAIGRTILDYRFAWTFYFPGHPTSAPVAPDESEQPKRVTVDNEQPTPSIRTKDPGDEPSSSR